MVIRGDPNEDAVLCTDDKTYELRIADTSNALLITPTLMLPKDQGKTSEAYCLGTLFAQVSNLLGKETTKLYIFESEGLVDVVGREREKDFFSVMTLSM